MPNSQIISSTAFAERLDIAIKENASHLFEDSGDNYIGQRKAIVRRAIRRYLHGGEKALHENYIHMQSSLTLQFRGDVNLARAFIPFEFTDSEGRLASKTFIYILAKVIELAKSDFSIDLEGDHIDLVKKLIVQY